MIAAGITHISNLNRLGYAGHEDWRLPTLEEAYSLLEPEKITIDRLSLHIDPILGEAYPFIWTSDQDPDRDEPWVLSYMSGDAVVNVTNNITREYKFSVRAVRTYKY